MKKFISVLLILTLSISVFSFSASATQNETSLGIDISKYTDSELDLTQFTMEDILSMSPEEYCELIREFERVYDPYGAYETSNSPYGTSLQWTSGEINNKDEWEEIGYHEYISACAYGIMGNDKGVFFNTDSTAKVLAMLHISYASLLPDKKEKWDGGLFAAHFYNPNTKENYLGSTKYTARAYAVMHYDAAIEAAENHAPVKDIYRELGQCLHYVQDASEPHHAANIPYLPPLYTAHNKFEEHAFNIMKDCLDYYASIPNTYYTTASNTSVSNITHNAAEEAYQYAEKVKDSSVTTHWDVIAGICLQNAARYSAMVLYKFGQEPSVPFYRN